MTGNRTVTASFSPSRRGKCCSFLSWGVFVCWFGVFGRFFAVLLFLGSLFRIATR